MLHRRHAAARQCVAVRLAAVAAIAAVLATTEGAASVARTPIIFHLTWQPGASVTYGTSPHGIYVVGGDGTGKRRLSNLGSGDAIFAFLGDIQAYLHSSGMAKWVADRRLSANYVYAQVLPLQVLQLMAAAVVEKPPQTEVKATTSVLFVI